MSKKKTVYKSLKYERITILIEVNIVLSSQTRRGIDASVFFFKTMNSLLNSLYKMNKKTRTNLTLWIKNKIYRRVKRVSDTQRPCTEIRFTPQ